MFWLLAPIVARLPVYCGGELPRGWADIPAVQSECSIMVTLSTEKETYFIGERIPVDVTYHEASGQRVVIPGERAPRFHRESGLKWFAERTTDTLAAVDPFVDYYGPLRFGVHTQDSDLLEPFGTVSQRHDLNEWLWFREPGEYRLRLVTTRIHECGTLLSEPFTLTIRERTTEDRDAVVARFRRNQLKAGNARDLRYLHDRDLLHYYVAIMTQEFDETGVLAIVGIPPPYQETLDALRELPDRVEDSNLFSKYDLAVTILSDRVDFAKHGNPDLIPFFYSAYYAY